MAELQTPGVFLQDFIKCSNKAKSSIRLQSMNFETGKAMDALEKSLLQAAKRGVNVEIYFDWVANRYMHGELPLLPIVDKDKRRYFRELHEKNRQMRERFRNGNVKLGMNNTPSRLTSWLPILRRNHKKMYLVDDTTAWIGGVNLFDLGFEMIDFMVKFTDQAIVHKLAVEYTKNESKTQKSDYAIPCTSHETLYIDSGIVGKSLIYDTACQRVASAKKSIVFMSQYVPDSFLLRELVKAAKRGLAVSIVTSDRQDIKFTQYPEKLTYQYLKRQIQRQPGIKLIHLPHQVHAKLILIDNNRALFGSHNYTHTGPLLGTEELMMESEDHSLISQIQKFLKDLGNLPKV